MNRTTYKTPRLVLLPILAFSLSISLYPRTPNAQDTPAVDRTVPPTASAEHALSREIPAGLFRKKKRQVRSLTIRPQSGSRVPIEVIRRQAENVARMGLPYSFGGCSPSDGGMDCSGSMKYLLSSLGYHNVPRTSYAQYDWMRKYSRIKRTKTIDPRSLRPGDLIFWGGTYESGHKVSHVMLYMGQSPNGKLYMFGARGKKMRGVSGAGVDVHELRPGSHKNLIGFGALPHLPG